MPIFKIGLIGTKEITVEEGTDERDACWKAGWDPDKCRAQDITAELAEAKANGTYRIYELRTPAARMRQIEEMFSEISREAIPSKPLRYRG